MIQKIKWRIGAWAMKKSFAYYKSQTDTNGKPGSYYGLPRYLEMLSNWYGGFSLRQRWVIRKSR